MSNPRNVEDVYPLSPMQEGMLFHSVSAPGSGVYITQLACTLEGLRVEPFKRAWQAVVDRHPILRTGFVWKNTPRLLQVVGRQVGVPLDERDWRELPPGEQAERWAEHVRADRHRDFEPGKAPLLRLCLARVGEDSWRLLWTCHHILLDGWCVSIVLREIFTLYQAFLEGGDERSAGLGPPRPYRDYIAWLQRQDGTAAETFWRGVLRGFTTPTPVDFGGAPDAPRALPGHGRERLALDEATTAAAEQLARRHNLTLNTLALGAWALFLGRASGEPEVLFGTVASGRPPELPGVEEIVGPFLNTLPLRVGLGSAESVLAWLLSIQSLQVDMRQYEHTPLADLRRWSDVPAGRGLFDSVLAFESYPRPEATLAGVPGLAVRDVWSDEQTHFPLSVSFVPSGGRLLINVFYERARSERTAVQRLLGQVAALLAGMVAEPGRRLDEVPLLSPAERHQLEVEWSDTALELPAVTVPALLAAQAARTPEAPALLCGGVPLTYGELERRANRLAHLLVAHGVGAESRVGLCLERSPEMVVALLAVWKAGGAWVPLDPALPPDRLGFLVEDGALALLVGDAAGAERLPPAPVLRMPRLLLDAEVETLARQPESAPPVAVRPGQAAYLIYTSGTTGRPKAVAVEHGNLAGILLGCLERFGRGGWESMLHLASFSFDIALFELLMPLLNGGRAVLLRREEMLDGRALAAHAGRVKALHAVPSLFRELLAGRGEAVWPGVERLFVGGDAVPPELLAALRRAFPAAALTVLYGPTEGTILATSWAVPENAERSLLGRALPNVRLKVVDHALRPVPIGVAGELCLGGAGVTRGYLGREELTRGAYVLIGGERLYRTGDLVRWRGDGNLEFLGRSDTQVKVRGFRIELGEIEAALRAHPGVGEAVVLARPQEPGGDPRLVAYLVPSLVQTPERAPAVDELREHLRGRLPEPMVPSAFVILDALPLTPHGKVDRRALPAPDAVRAAGARPGDRPGDWPGERPAGLPASDLERAVARVWQEVLGVDSVGTGESFFAAGGDSLLLMRLCGRLEQTFGREVPIADLFRHSTVASQARYLASAETPDDRPLPGVEARVAARSGMRHRPSDAVAIVGMACRFPGAGSLEAFWHNLVEGIESISVFDDRELAAAGVDPALLSHPRYVRARGILEDVAGFDAPFFGLTANEATVMDPQHRLFLECSWEALEDAAIDPERFAGRVSVFAGCGPSAYLFTRLLGDEELLRALGRLQVILLNDRDFLATQTAYRLGLRGLSTTVQSACSTSLVAVHLACQGLLAGECDAALAGGVSISIPQTAGYLAEEGGVFSPDGHCRAFDAAAQGTLSGSGCGAVVLKRLSDALADGDPIHAVIRGTAAGNDGALRAGFTAPGVEGQMEVIAESLGVAGVDPETIGYVEAHGSGTPLGDPIEIAAITQAYRTRTTRTGFCPIGSVKTNIGHLDTAAGVAGLIKTVLALEHGMVPPSLHFEQPNPRIDFAASPFYVSTRATPWPEGSTPRRAGVSSFGLGGTNVHAVLEQAPAPEAPEASSRPCQLLTLSAASAAALDRATARLREALESAPDLDPADVAFTLQTGRKELRHRRAVLCVGREDALAKLAPGNLRAASTGIAASGERPLAFLFPGVGDHHPGMARAWYESEPVVRAEIDRCAEILRPHLGLDLRSLLCAEAASGPRPLFGRRSPEPADGLGELGRTAVAQPAVFVVEYALARLLMHWGLRPRAMIGYSIGEYVAACLAGVMTLDEALPLVAARARLIESLPAGAMLAVPLPEEALAPRLGAGLSLAALDGPHLSVVAGAREEIEELDRRLGGEGVACLWLDAAHAFHSQMMEPAVAGLRDLVSRVALRPPAIPFLSNVTGTWIGAEEATDPGYWARHLRQTVRFGDGLGELLREPGRILVEAGPGSALSVLVRQHPLSTASHLVASTTCRPEEGGALEHLHGTLGRLWTAGVRVDWRRFHDGERRRRVRLPTYPFERQRHWAEGRERARDVPNARPPAADRPLRPLRNDLRDWFWLPTWREAVSNRGPETAARLTPGGRWLLFLDPLGLGRRLADRLTQAGQTVVTVVRGETGGDSFRDLGGGAYALEPRRREGYERLVERLRAEGAMPGKVIHLWTVAPLEDEGADAASFERWQDLGLHSLLGLVQALGEGGEEERDLRLGVVSTHLQAVLDGEPLVPAKATLLGACRVIPLEAQGVRCRSLDVPLTRPGSPREARLVEQILAEMLREAEPVEPFEEIAFRGRQRWVRVHEPLACDAPAVSPACLKPGGGYLITGGNQPLGLTLAELLARSCAARLVLIADPGFPARQDWEEWLAAHRPEDPASAAIRRVKEIERSGAEVAVLSADVADEPQLRSALALARERLGHLDGIFHAAASASNGMIQLRTPEGLSGVRGAHARGALLLASLVREIPADLLVLCSSLTAVLGGVGQVDLCASGAFLAALAQAESQRGEALVTAIEWGPLQGAGAGGFAVQALDEQLEKNLETFGISAEEVGEALRRILADPVPRVAVSVRDLPSEIVQARRVTAAKVLEGMAKAQSSGRAHARPELSTPYVAPRNEVEASLEEIWKQLFGIDRVGVLDNFFELSGHSLLAIQMVTRMRERFQLDLPVTVVFDAPTIDGLAARVLHARLELLEPDELADAARLLAEIRNLSPDQVRQRLAEPMGESPGPA